jgi:hypothetical protein
MAHIDSLAVIPVCGHRRCVRTSSPRREAGREETRRKTTTLHLEGRFMKRATLSLVIAGILAGGLVAATPGTARADHRRSGTSVGVFVGSGGFSFGYGYGPRRYYGPYAPYYPVAVPAYAPVVAPTCCHLERVYVPPSWDAWGVWHPGFYRTYRVCDQHGRVLVY